ncbi:hypothetical protein AeNC1_004379 [Aphanomyces euteiches]|nr:hypothetical protein AeNC1_004379 [Aphanomyces euteiches]
MRRLVHRVVHERVAWPNASTLRSLSTAVSSDIYAQKLQHHLLDSDFDTALQVFKAEQTNVPSNLMAVMSIVEHLAKTDEARLMQKYTIAFFLKRQHQVAPTLVTAYKNLGISIPQPLLREVVLSLLHENETSRALEVIGMAFRDRVPISADIFYQCFSQCEELSIDPRPFAAMFIQFQKAQLVNFPGLPSLGSVILSVCFSQGAIADGLACVSLLPPSSVDSKKLQFLRQAFEVVDSTETTALHQTLIAFVQAEDDSKAWEAFSLLREKNIAMTSAFLKDIGEYTIAFLQKLIANLAAALFRLGRQDQANEVFAFALTKKIKMPALAFMLGFQKSRSLSLATLYRDALQQNLVEPTAKVLSVAMRVAFEHSDSSLALDLRAIFDQQNFTSADKRLNATLDYVARSASHDQDIPPLVIDFVLNQRTSAAMPLFRRLVEAQIDIHGDMLQGMLNAAEAASNAEDLLTYAMKNGVALGTAAVVSSLARWPQDSLAAIAVDLIHANLVQVSPSLIRRINAAAAGDTYAASVALWDLLPRKEDKQEL